MWEFFFAFLDLVTALPPGRVTVKERYEMKRKVRELRAKEKAAAERAAKAG